MNSVPNILNLKGIGHIFKAKVPLLPYLKDRTMNVLSRFFLNFYRIVSKNPPRWGAKKFPPAQAQNSRFPTIESNKKSEDQIIESNIRDQSHAYGGACSGVEEWTKQGSLSKLSKVTQLLNGSNPIDQ